MIQQLQSLLTLTFVVSSMLGMGMALTPRQVAAPLRRVRVLVLALVASFVIVPAAALLLSMIPADPQFKIGILLIGAGAGAPFLLKLADVALGDVPLAVGLLVLLVLGTAVYLPLTLPLVAAEVQVDGLAILRQLSLQMLLPLGLGLFAFWRYPEETAGVQPTVQTVANVSLVLLIALMLTANVRQILQMIGTGAILAILALIAIGMLSGWLLGGPTRASRATVALATGHRNYAAAFIVAGGSFADQPNVFVFLACAAPINMVMSFALAGELRRRNVKRAERALETGRAEARA
jgi:BASS family bile acid:Na+ symporter